jgi:hypothetical protein
MNGEDYPYLLSETTLSSLSNHFHFSRIDSPSDSYQDSSNSFQEWSGSELLQSTSNLLCHPDSLWMDFVLQEASHVSDFNSNASLPLPSSTVDRLSCHHHSLVKLKIHLSQDLLPKSTTEVIPLFLELSLRSYLFEWRGEARLSSSVRNGIIQSSSRVLDVCRDEILLTVEVLVQLWTMKIRVGRFLSSSRD